MTDEIIQDVDQTLAGELTDESLDKFFENGGEEETAPPPQEEKQDQSIPEQSPDQEIDQANKIEEERHARNYQAAMKEERARRQELQRQLEETNAKQAILDQRLQAIFQRTQAENQPKLPSYDEDPLGHQQHKIAELEEYIIKQNNYLQQTYEQQQAQIAENNFRMTYAKHVQEFAKEAPDFMVAYNHLVGQKVGEFMAGGLTFEEADHQIKLEEARLVGHALRQGANPAERIYAMAKAAGYNNQQAAPQSLTTQQTSQADEVSKKLEQIQKSLVTNKSLSNAGGNAESKPAITLQRIADMDDDEFDKFDWNKFVKAA